MTISLTPELRQFVDEQVRDGKFASSDQAILEAVRLMKEREEKLQWLRRELQVSIDQAERGEVAEWDLEDTKNRLRQRLAREGKVI
jgi:antitoxin ParD1/3/4